MTRSANDADGKEFDLLERACFFFSSGLFILPFFVLYILFNAELERLLELHEWWYHGLIVAAGLVVVAGMYALEFLHRRKFVGLVGVICWVILFVVVWQFSARGFK